MIVFSNTKICLQEIVGLTKSYEIKIKTSKETEIIIGHPQLDESNGKEWLNWQKKVKDSMSVVLMVKKKLSSEKEISFNVLTWEISELGNTNVGQASSKCIISNYWKSFGA